MFFKKADQKIEHIKIDKYEVEVTFKSIKNLYLKVSRRSGEIRVSVPHRTPQKMVKKFVLSRSKWIDKHLAKPLPKEYRPKFQNGETVKYFGQNVPLKIDYVNKNINAYIHKNVIILQIRSEYDVEKREDVLNKLYRRELKILVDQLIKKWEPIMGVDVAEFGIKKMKTRWGTCNIRDKRIWLNLQLAKESIEVIEMVVVHEMVHLLERLHNKRFYSFMDEFLPDWKERSKELDGRVC
jgi:predicted metal-dependent hydrolase